MDSVKHVTLGQKSIVTPCVVASYRINDFPRAGLLCHPWQLTDTQSVLVNAYDLLANPRTKKYTEDIRQREHKLHDHIEFSGPIILDSGAFNFLKDEKVSIEATDVLNIGIEMETDMAVVLDHPFPPHLANTEEMQVRWGNTMRNTREMFEALGDHTRPYLMPVLHGHDHATLHRGLDELINFLGHEPHVIGIGSLAPIAQNGSKHTAIDVLLAVRKLLPNAHIHCFSMGSALLMLLAFYCGADTVDSQTWILSAAFKQAQMPGYYITRLSYKEHQKDSEKYTAARNRFAEHLLHLVEHNYCVRDWISGEPWIITTHRDALSYVDYLEDQQDLNRVHQRACHNLYSFNFEARSYREELINGNVEDFIRKRVAKTKYSKVFEYAVQQKHKG